MPHPSGSWSRQPSFSPVSPGCVLLTTIPHSANSSKHRRTSPWSHDDGRPSLPASLGRLMDEQPSAGAPPVVAVVVTRDPGPWFEDALAALADQDYPNLSVLVVDAGGDPGLTARVASVL